jgi:hypothetical protein
MKSKFAKFTVVIGLMAASVVAFAASSDCCASIKCCLDMLSCC